MRRTAVILDAHPLWLDAVEGVLERLDLDVVGKTSSFAEGHDLVADTRPDVLPECAAATADFELR